MTREEVIRLAKEADAYRYVNRAAKDEPTHTFTVEKLERFAELVAAAEREAILELRNHEDVMAPVGQSAWGEAYQDGWIAGVQEYVDQIRARGDSK